MFLLYLRAGGGKKRVKYWLTIRKYSIICNNTVLLSFCYIQVMFSCGAHIMKTIATIHTLTSH